MIRLIATILIGLGIVGLPQASWAQTPPTKPGNAGAGAHVLVGELASRPRTWRFMQGETRALVAQREGLYKQNYRRMEAGNRALRLATDKAERKYFNGAEPDEIADNNTYDFEETGVNFAQCTRYEASGVCYRIRNMKLESRALVDYNYPVAKIETVEQPFESGYLPRQLQESSIIPASYSTFSSGKLDELRVSWGLGRAEMAKNILGARLGHTFDTAVSSNPDSTLGLSLGVELSRQSPTKFGLKEKQRWSTRPRAHPGARNVEFHLMPELGFMPLANQDVYCHQIIYSLWQSEYPQGLIASRVPAMSFFYWPRELAMLLRDPTLCSSFNAGLGKTPADMFKGLFVPARQAPGGGGLSTSVGGFGGALGFLSKPVLNPCQATNAGPWLPVTNEANSDHWTDAARVGVVRALRTAEASLRAVGISLSHTYKPERGDTFSWTAGDHMPKGCAALEKWKLDERPGANASLNAGQDPWSVAVFWPRFTCCQGWRAETPDFVVSKYGSSRCTVPGSCDKILRLY